MSFNYDKICKCSLNEPCSDSEEWHILAVSHLIGLIDAEVGMLLFEKMRNLDIKSIFVRS